MRKTVSIVLSFVMFAVLLSNAAPAADKKSAETSAAEEKDTFEQSVRPLLKKFCYNCHSGEDDESEAELSVDGSWNHESVRRDRKRWERVLEALEQGKMPPKFVRQPSKQERDAAVAWLEATLRESKTAPDPGRVTLRRLNRVEYANTVRDLLGVEFDAGKDFPADDVGYGFDNIGDVLSLPPLLMEKHMTAAEEIAERAIVVGKNDDHPQSHRQIIFVRPGKDLSEKEAATKIIRRLATRAFRRPATDDEVDRLAGLVEAVVKEGEFFEAGVRLAVQAVLCSPHFLFMVPRDVGEGKNSRELDEYELATRLSYFLWSSMPDDELFEHATRGTLRKNLEPQVLRMLKDGKSQALVDNFFVQWLQLRNLETVTPDKKMFGSFDDDLRRDMAAETRLFVADVIGKDRSLLELIDADFTFVNQRLAGLYGIEGVKGDKFRRISLKGTPRGGVLTQASILTVTSNPTRTSPVKRGKWIMENILGTPPPDPPANVPMLEDQAKLTGSLRERMEQHRKDPTCAVCHKTMDPLGFAMENFDAVGRWRTRDGKHEIDASGALPDGKKFNGPAELRRLLLDIGHEDYARCVAEKTLTYALGRGMERADKDYVDAIARKLSEGNFKFSSLALAVVNSDPFQKRGPKQEKP
ncbi:MAG: DUF1592 domain-containing protein [Pirellulales bacterium]|nr:DUF1592 domain-containing protein [Pirellulales bacterium]